MDGVELRVGDASYAARLAGCTCAWLRGYGVGPDPAAWTEVIIDYDDKCQVHDKGGENRC